MQIQTKKARKPTTASGQQPYRESRGLYEMAGRSLTKSPRDEPYMQLRRLFVSAVLSLICILISPVLSTDALWNVISAETTNNADTTMASSSCLPSFNPLLSATQSTYIFHHLAQGMTSTTSFYLFKSKTGPVYKMGTAAASGLQDIYTVVLTEAKTMYAGGLTGNRELQIHNMVYNTGTGLYSQTGWTTNSAVLNVSKLVYEAGTTNYLYYHRDFRAHKFDLITAAVSSGLTTAGTIPHGMDFISSSLFLVWGRGGTNMEFVDKTTMTIAKTLTGSLQGWIYTVDNLLGSNIFALPFASPYGLIKVTLDATAGTYTEAIRAANAYISSNILNFGPYQYIGLVRTDQGWFRMYSKGTVAEVGPLVFTAVAIASMQDNTLVQGPSEGNKFFLAYHSNAAGLYNFQSYYIQFDLCTTRSGSGQHDPTGTCSACPANYYLSQTGVPGNQCYPNGWGINSGSTPLVPCADTNCLECPTSSTICRKCTQTPTKYWSQGTDPTTCVTTPPASRFGIDATEFLYVACSDSNCLNCAASNTVCTGCDVTGGWYLNSTNCIRTTQFAPNQGLRASDGSVQTCAATNCVNCVSNFSVCTACNVSAGYYVFNGGCINTTSFTPSQGIRASDGSVQTCAATNCVNCVSNFSVCTACNVSAGYYVFNGGCINTTSFTPSQGIRASDGSVQTCAATNCVNCVSNFSVCTACNVSAGYYVFNGGCINTTSFTPSQGIRASDGSVQTCAATNCVNCVSNFSVCTACNVSAGYYVFNGGCINTTSFTPSQGIRASDGSVQTCAATNCVNCVSNFSVCTACNVSAGYYVFNGGCINTTSFTPSQGIRASDGSVQTCAATNCVNCVSNFSVCTACNVTGGFYLYGQVCIPPAMFATDQGIRASDGTVQNCLDANCVNCVSNFSACAACNTTGGWYLLGVTCLKNTSFSPNQGAGLLDGKVYNCADSNCINCVADYTKCTSCNTTASFYRNNTVCVALATFAPWEGVDVATGTVRNCSDVNCINCKANSLVCVACNTTNDWYLSGSICRSPSSFAPNEGIRASNGTVAPCVDPNCVNCKRNISMCIACDTVNGWYLDGLTCKTTSMFSSRQGISSGDGLVKSCTDSNCINCTLDFTTCRACDTSLGWFRNTTTSTCQQNSTFRSNQGARSADGTVQFCSDVNCVNCVSDNSVCIRCDTTKGYYLLGKNCIQVDSIGAGQGINSDLGTIVACQDPNCLSCKANYQICINCNTAAGFYRDGTKCMAKKDFSPRQGVNPSDGTVSNCTDPHCINCLNNYQICTECDQANGYIVETSNSTCKQATTNLIFFVFSPLAVNKARVDIAARIQVDRTTVLDPKLCRQIYKKLQYEGIVSVNFMSRSNPGQMTSGDTTLTVEAGATSAVINIKFNTYLPDKDYDVYIKSESILNITFEGVDYTVYPAEGTFDYTNPIDKSQAETLYTLFDGFSPLVSQGGTATSKLAWITLALLALDPTGTFFRFTKILQIVNKLYFININYGKRLEAFLAKSAYAIKDDKRTQVYHSTSTRGKLTAQMVPLDILNEETSWKFGLYWISGLFAVASQLLRKYTDAGYRKWMLYFCHYANKVHLVIFNLVFIDFIWLAPRTLLHSHNLSVFRYIAALLTATLIFADCLHLFRSVSRAWSWKILKQAGKWPDLYLEKVTSDTNQPQTKQINYKKTYFEIDFNVHLMNWCGYTAINSTEAAESSLLVTLSLGAFTRPVVFLFSAVSTQYATLFGVTIYLSYEVLRILATIYAYLKYKYLKNIICLLMEVSQSIFMIAFTSLALLISPKRFDEPVIDFYQDAGIWIVIASCVAEYLLLITYITVAAYEFIKNRNMMKKMNVKLSPVSFIKPKQSTPEETSFSSHDQTTTRKTFFSGFGTFVLGSTGLFTAKKQKNTASISSFAGKLTAQKFYNRPTHYFASRLKAANANSATSLISKP